MTNLAIQKLLQSVESQQQWLHIAEQQVVEARDAMYEAINRRDQSQKSIEDTFVVLEQLGYAHRDLDGTWIHESTESENAR